MKGLKVIATSFLITCVAHAGGFFSDLKNTDWTETAKTYYGEAKTLYDKYGVQIKDAGSKLGGLYQQNQTKPSQPTPPKTQPKSTIEKALDKLEQAQLLQQQAELAAQNITSKATAK